MGNTRTYVRLLRHLGVALIFAPEPFTTPLGVAFILTARHLSKRHEASVNNHLRETVRYYLAHTGHLGDYADGASSAPGPSKRPRLGEERPILGQITGSRSFEAQRPARKGRQDMREKRASRPSPRYEYGDGRPGTFTATQNVIRHTIDMEWLSQRYEGASTAAHSNWTTTSGGMEGATRHCVSMGLPSREYGTDGAGRGKENTHIVDIAQLGQRYGPAMSYTAAVNALRNNNHYYDVVSKRNVIGGY
jgi:hypothetical protein